MYPKSLREIHSPPIVLYVWGELQERDQHAIGIIGSRRTTHYGTESAKKLSYQLAYAGLTVISGLARGIDTAAHQGALAAKGRTIAVIGSGLSKLYPPENAALAEKIRSGNGAILSEFSMEIEPDRQTFPMRNRIISGWSQGILDCGSGLEQWRANHRFAGDRAGPLCLRRAGSHQCPERDGIEPPDSARREAGDGCVRYSRRSPNSLAGIKTDRQLPRGRCPNYQNRSAAFMTRSKRAKPPSTPSRPRCNLPSPTVSSVLLRLELKRLVKQLPGKYFVKLG